MALSTVLYNRMDSPMNGSHTWSPRRLFKPSAGVQRLPSLSIIENVLSVHQDRALQSSCGVYLTIFLSVT